MNLIAPHDLRRPPPRQDAHVQPRQLERPAAAPYPVTYRWRRGSVTIGDARPPTRSPPTTSASSLNCQVTANTHDGRHQRERRRARPPEADHRAGDHRRPAPAPDDELQPRRLARGRGRAVRDHLPLAAQQHRDPRRDGRHVHDHHGRPRHQPVLRGPGREPDREPARRPSASPPRACVLGQVLERPAAAAQDDDAAGAARGTTSRADRYAVTHQWLRDGVAIPDATQATYAVAGDRHRPSRSPARRARRRARRRTPSTAPRPSARPLNRMRPAPVAACPASASRSAARAATGTTRPTTATASPTAGSAAPPRSPNADQRRPTRSRPPTSSRTSTAASAPRT